MNIGPTPPIIIPPVSADPPKPPIYQWPNGSFGD